MEPFMSIEGVPPSEASATCLATEGLISSIYALLVLRHAQLAGRPDVIFHVANVHVLAHWARGRVHVNGIPGDALSS
jgi:hypothetical protein